jgi:hypothetical protein
MPAPPSQPHDTLTAIAVLAVTAACLCTIYWRVAVRVIVAVAAALALTGAGVVIYGLISLMASHHG